MSPKTRMALRLADTAVNSYVSRKGDNLVSIAKRMLPDGAGTRELLYLAQRLYYLNEKQIGPDPVNIRPGTKLKASSR